MHDTDLVHEHVMRHGAGVHAQMHDVGAGAIDGRNDAVAHFVGRAPGHGLSTACDVFHGQVAEILAQALCFPHILRANVIKR